MKFMTIFVKLLSVLALLMAVRMAGAQTGKVTAEVAGQKEVPHQPAAQFTNTPGVARRSAGLASKRSIGEVRLMYVRQDANAILNLDAKPIESAPAPAAAIIEAPPVQHKPTLIELKTQLKAAQGQYDAAKLELRAASRAKDAVRAAEARAALKATQQSITTLKADINALEPKQKAKKKATTKKKVQAKQSSVTS
jgi:hypothetical protein